MVDPDAFRRGTASGLVRAALFNEPEARRAVAQTGAADEPARALYLRQGFELADEVVVGGGVRVARFAKRCG